MKIKARIIKFLVFIVIIAIAFGYYHARCIAPYNFSIKNDTVIDKRLPQEFDNFKIAFISDINLKNTDDLTRLDEIIASLNSQHTDMVIFGGDLFDSNPFDNDVVIKSLSKIKSAYGKFAVLGEKDLASLKDVSVILNEGGFEILHNEYRPIYYKNSIIGLFGLEGSGDVTGLLNENNQDVYKLVTVHEPDYFNETSKSSISLQLSGHTMGGYIRFPGINNLLKWKYQSDYIYGLHEKNGSKLIISNGLSPESDSNYRLFCPNQINIITLKSNN